MNNLDQEEQEILAAFEAGTLQRSKSADKLHQEHRAYAESMLKKDARINIRLPSKDLRGIQKKALSEGIPYQTLVASIIHKYIEGRLQESPR